jgi:hypothetical protein
MITDINNPQFNLANIPPNNRFDYAIQLSDVRYHGFITQDELLNILDEWYIQVKVSGLKC